MNTDKPVYVTSPLLPPLEEFKSLLDDIWEKKRITNNGEYHQKLEKALAEYLGVPYLSLFTNGTLPLVAAFQALGTTGEVITTPYSFVATANALWWNRLEPVFVDVDEKTGNMDPSLVEAAITSKTRAILPVHVYGTPCDTARIEEIAQAHNLEVIYDAAHAFGVTVQGESVLNSGTISTLSFHATKVFNTIEGGALVCTNPEIKERVDSLINFGFANETTLVAPGLNSKLDEVRSAYGLLNLVQVDDAINKRAAVAKRYRQSLSAIEGIRFLPDNDGVRSNYAYFPVFIDEQVYGSDRDSVLERLKDRNIYARRYFYPVISSFSAYRHLPSASPENLPVAMKLARQVLCLPMYADLSDDDVDRVVDIIRKD